MSKRMKTLLPAVVFVSILALSGCQPEIKTDTALQPEAMGEPEPLESKPLGIGDARTTQGMLPVYYDYDSSEIRADQVSRIGVNADFMKDNLQYQVRIEGNCDPRGTNEYNMALGERRAQSARKYMVNLGVDESRLSTISYGEERMLLLGQDELSWAQNRRCDFVVAE